MTDAELLETFHHTHERAKVSRAADGFKDESFLPGAIVIGADCKMIMIACPFSDNYEKAAAMRYIWKTAKEEKAVAVFFYSDSRQIENKAYCAHYGIALSEFEEHRQRTLREVGGSYSSLPREVWQDSIITWGSGPRVPVNVLSTAYTEGPDDTVVFAPTEDHKDDKIKQYLMPQWW